MTIWWKATDDSKWACSEFCNAALTPLAYSACKSENPEDPENTMGAGGVINVGCGIYSYHIMSPKHKDATIWCRGHELIAPKYYKVSDGDKSMEAGIEEWCNDIDGKTLGKRSGTENVWQGHGITKFGISNRDSFWLRANLNDCGELEKIQNQDWSHGYRASIDCIDYQIDLSESVWDGSPPWNEEPAFPAPERLSSKGPGPAHQPVCYPKNAVGDRPLTNEELEPALDAYCKDGTDIRGYSKYWEYMFSYPPKGERQFSENDDLTMHLQLGSETVNNGAPELYDNMGWWKGYDWKLGRDDCKYAFRKFLYDCNNVEGKFIGGTYTYRCVTYKIYDVNIEH
ncbi:hypothetical protein K458DRAFT_397313 [Lentithecium fluviatile CBS 122367]|uniref:Uncharacterized protein n=1 Tax=Lentithecium fluviatile CBS 122367 TaxID=1168545 RepID=A0A6G1ID59_9PLEO|nr:hypothetical protein K458DRAFT_397313 [Lentithecium fluviatile CBS 122367]